MAQISQFASQVTSPTLHTYDLLDYRPDLTEDESERRTMDWCNAVAEESQQWLIRCEEAVEIDNYVSFLMGKQWPSKRPSYKSAPVNNLLLRSMEQTVAVLTDIRTAYEAKSENKTYTEQADTLTKTAKCWWVNQSVDLQMAMAVIHAYLTTGYLRVVWNERLMNGKGDFQVIPEGVNSVLPIGTPCHDIQDWEGLRYTSARPMSWFKRKFPKTWYKVKPSAQYSTYTKSISKPAYVGKTAFSMLSPQMQRVLAGRPTFAESAIPHAGYNEFWIRDYSLNTSDKIVDLGEPGTNWFYRVKPGEMLYPRGRLIITGGDNFARLFDGPNPHWHGRWPYICIRLKPVPWQFHGVSELRTKIPLQNIVNNILAGILDMIKKAVNPALIYPSNAFGDAVQRAMDPSMPNLKLSYSALSMAAPQYARPPEMPSYVVNTMQYAEQALQDDSGLLDLAGLSRKKISPAGDTLSQLKENQQTIMRLRGRYMEFAVSELGEQMIPNFLQFYTLQRRMHMLGQHGVMPEDVFDWNPKTMIPAGVAPDQYIRNFAFQVVPGSLLNANRQELATLAMALRRQGDMSRKTLFQMLDIDPMYDKVMKELDEEKQRSLQEAVIGALMQAAPAIGGLFQGGGQPGKPGALAAQSGGKGSRNDTNVIAPES